MLDVIETSLRHADLVKFARLTPSEEECELSLVRAEQIVRSTIPAMPLPPASHGRTAGSAPPPSSPDSGGKTRADRRRTVSAGRAQ